MDSLLVCALVPNAGDRTGFRCASLLPSTHVRCVGVIHSQKQCTLLVKLELMCYLCATWAKFCSVYMSVALSSDIAFEANPAAPWWVLAMESSTALHFHDLYFLEMHSRRCSRQMLRVASAALQEPLSHGQARMNLLGMMTHIVCTSGSRVKSCQKTKKWSCLVNIIQTSEQMLYA